VVDIIDCINKQELWIYECGGVIDMIEGAEESCCSRVIVAVS